VKAACAGNDLIARLEPGDDVLGSLAALCAEYDIKNAEITGIGSIESPVLAHYRRDTKHFTERAFDGIYEIVSLLGNVALVEGRPVAHCHVTIADEDMVAWAGHLVRGTCSATLELIIRPLASAYSKSLDETVGLKVWQL
jgi:uncharacterized protein